MSKDSGGPPWVLIGGTLVIGSLAVFALYSSSMPEANTSAASTESPMPVSSVEPENPESSSSSVPSESVASKPVAPEPQESVQASPRPAPDALLPPLPFVPNLVPRSPEVISDAYVFTARNPDVSEFVPCFCGCETRGHKANADCFVQSRNTDGSVKSWEPHGMACAVCVDVARDSQQLRASGASVRDVRASIEDKYVPLSPRITPTPQPPQ